MSEPHEHRHPSNDGPSESDESATLVRHEEEVAGVDTRWRGAGHVHVHKTVHTERVREDYPRDVEDVELRRTPVGEGDSGEVETLPDGSISIPVFEERLVVTKERVLKERVIVEKRMVTERQRVRAELRKERVSFDADDGIEIEDDGAQRDRFSTARLASGAETRPFVLTSEFLALVAVVAGLLIAGATDALDAPLLWLLVTAAVVTFVLARGFAKANTPAGPQPPAA